MNIISNFASNELITCDDWGPPWMNPYIKNLIVAINDFSRKFVLPSSNSNNLFMFKNLQSQLIQSIHIAKPKYFNKISKKLCDPLVSTMCYWSLLKTMLNRKKVPYISHNNKYVSNFKVCSPSSCTVRHHWMYQWHFKFWLPLLWINPSFAVKCSWFSGWFI